MNINRARELYAHNQAVVLDIDLTEQLGLLDIILLDWNSNVERQDNSELRTVVWKYVLKRGTYE